MKNSRCNMLAKSMVKTKQLYVSAVKCFWRIKQKIISKILPVLSFFAGGLSTNVVFSEQSQLNFSRMWRAMTSADIHRIPWHQIRWSHGFFLTSETETNGLNAKKTFRREMDGFHRNLMNLIYSILVSSYLRISKARQYLYISLLVYICKFDITITSTTSNKHEDGESLMKIATSDAK